MRRHPQFINRIVAEELRKALLKRMSGSVTLIVDLEAHAAHRKPSGGRRRALDHDNSGPDHQVHYGGVQTGALTSLAARPQVLSHVVVPGVTMTSLDAGQSMTLTATVAPESLVPSGTESRLRLEARPLVALR